MNKQKIEFFAWPDSGSIKIDAGLERHTQLSEFYQTGDEEKIVDNWDSQLKTGKFSYSAMVGSLWNVRKDNGVVIASYLPTKYHVYNAVACPHKSSKSLSNKLRELMRVSSIGGVILTLDDKVLVQRRSTNVFAGGLLDSGVAGFSKVDEECRLNFDSAVFEKLERELDIFPKDVSLLCQTSLHSSMGHDYSGMIGYLIKVNMEFEKIKDKLNEKYIDNILPTSINQIPEFLFEHYVKREDMIGDGCALLLSILEPNAFMTTVQELKRRGKNIDFGILQEGKFVPTG